MNKLRIIVTFLLMVFLLPVITDAAVTAPQIRTTQYPVQGSSFDPAKVFQYLVYQDNKTAAFTAGTVYAATWDFTLSGEPPYRDFTLRPTIDQLTKFTETGTASVSKAEFDAWAYAVSNDIITLATRINAFSKRVGLPAIGLTTITTATESIGAATISTKGVATNTGLLYTSTVIKCTTDFTAASSSLVDATSGNFIWNRVIDNVATLAVGANRLGMSLGAATIKLATNGDINSWSVVGGLTRMREILDVTTSSAAVTGTATNETIAVAEMEVEALTVARNISTIAAYLDVILKGTELYTMGQLTDNSGGTASTVQAVTPFTTLAAYTGTATDLSQYTDFNAGVFILEKGISNIVNRINEVYLHLGCNLIDNEIALTSFTSYPNEVFAVDVSITAVDGSSDDALYYTEAAGICKDIEEYIYMMAWHVNNLAVKFGMNPMTVTLTSAPNSYFTTSSLADATSGGEGDEDNGVHNTVMNAWMVDARNNLATITAKINEIMRLYPGTVPPLVIVYD